MLSWSPTAYADNNGVHIAYDSLGSSGDPLLLVMGLGTSRFWWPQGLCVEFAAQDFEVVRYDQRDAGESDRMPDTSTSNPFAALFGKRGDAYTSEDMTDDAVAVMDELEWKKAHIFGHSSVARSPSASPCATLIACCLSSRLRPCPATCLASR